MKKHPTQEQFSAHACEHWRMGDDDDPVVDYQGEWCVMFDKSLDDPTLNCAPECPEYAPWDRTIDGLLRDQQTEERPEIGMNPKEVEI